MNAAAQSVDIHKDQIIFSEGDAGDCAYIIEKGRVLIYITKDKEEIPLTILGEGEIFGEKMISFKDPDGLQLQFIEPAGDDNRKVWTTDDIKDENALKDNPEKFLLDPELSDDLKLSIARMLVKELDKEALRFSELAEKRDIDQLANHLHSFKSSAGILCLRNTLKLIEEIEHDVNLNETITPFGIDKLNQLNQNILSTRNFLLKKLPHA
jgi:CRP-like cAMP-binding protein